MDEVRVKSLVAALKNIDISKVLEQAIAAPTVVAPVAAPTEAPAGEKEEKKEEEKSEEGEGKEAVSEEELAEGLGALFG